MWYENIPKVLSGYLDYLEKIKNYSYLTQVGYCLDVLCFFKFIKDFKEISVSIKDFNVFLLAEVKESDVRAFLVYLNFYRDNTGSTRQRKIVAIRSFYKWLIGKYSSKVEIINPTDSVERIRVVERLPKCLSLKQAREICHVFTKDNCKFPERNNLILGLFLNTGLRLSELANLKVGDIHFDEKYLRVIGKGNKERKVFLNERMRDNLFEFLKWQNNVSDLEKPLFLTDQNSALSNRSIENICKRAYVFMGLSEFGYTTHTLRHTFATIMYQETRDIMLVKELLGHDCVESTQVYAMVFPENVKRAVDSNPLNEFG